MRAVRENRKRPCGLVLVRLRHQAPRNCVFRSPTAGFFGKTVEKVEPEMGGERAESPRFRIKELKWLGKPGLNRLRGTTGVQERGRAPAPQGRSEDFFAGTHVPHGAGMSRFTVDRGPKGAEVGILGGLSGSSSGPGAFWGDPTDLSRSRDPKVRGVKTF